MATYGIYTTTLSLSLETKADSFSDNRSSFFTRHFASRFTYLMNIPVGIVTRIIDAVLSVFFMTASLATLSRDRKAFNLANRYLSSFSLLIPSIFKYVIKTINSQASFDSTTESLTNKIISPIFKLISELTSRKNNFFKRHVISRTLSALTIPLIVITRIVDFSIGLIIATAALLCFGSRPFLNNHAFHLLGITGIVQNIFNSVSFTINPFYLIK